MKIIHAVARYFPDAVGGIQIRLSELLPVLETCGMQNKVVAPHAAPQAKTYEYGGVEVFRYPAYPAPKPEPNHGATQHPGFAAFAEWLRHEQADVYHQHQLEPSCGLAHLRYAKSLGLATVFSVRLPTPICLRHTLMLNGEQPCDGQIDIVRCTRCCDVASKQLPSPLIQAFGHLPLSILNRLKLPQSVYHSPPTTSTGIGKLVRPIVIPAYVTARHRSLLAIAEVADRIVTLSQQMGEMLLCNGVPKHKLVICQTGLPDSFPRAANWVTRRESPLRIVFLGRLHRTKGVDLLVKAVRSLPPDLPVELIIHGISADLKYQDELMRLINQDARIQLKPPLTRQEIPQVVTAYDVLALPAQWFDVRPMSVLEAHALGLPVLGSDMGGITELIQHGVDGLLLPHDNVQAWGEAIARLASDRDMLEHLRRGIKPVRTIQMEAQEITTLYETMLSNSRGS